jgi:uncharacterized repeat protein (TIGR03803 family)
MSFVKFTQTRLLLFAVLAAVATVAPAQAQTETVLHAFTYSDGSTPDSGLTADGAGNFYGTTTAGGAFGAGTVYEVSPNGSGGWNETVLYSFTGGTDGWIPVSTVIFDSAGNLYGTTQNGGAYGKGTVFELSPRGGNWTETVQHSFAGNKAGAYPQTGLIMDAAGNLYGATVGCVFELSPSGGAWTEKVIYRLGKHEYISAGLAEDAAGNLFAAASFTVIELSPNGKGGWLRHVLHTFSALGDGAYAGGTPVLDHAGNLYGMTQSGGDANAGTVYELSPLKKGKWAEKILYSFQGGSDGSDPLAGLVFDAAGNLYGTTRGLGRPSGTVFELAPVGGGNYQEKVLWRFSGPDGSVPYGNLILDGAGNLYGTTYQGGSFEGGCGSMAGCGVVFEVTP